MGADLHCYPEIFKDGKWQVAEPFVLSSWWYDTIIDESDVEYPSDEYNDLRKKYESMSEKEILEKYGDDERIYWEHPFDRKHTSRNYYFFAVLADIRNYDDFIIPISDPKGLPDNVSPEIKKQSDHDGVDGHSHSWLTLEELESHDWNQSRRNSGTVTSSGFLEYYTKGKPSGYHGGSSAETVDNETMKQLILGIYGDRDPNGWYDTEVSWMESIRDSIGVKYLEDFLTALKAYGENVRIVFWFDN